MVCVHKGKSIFETFHQQDFFFLNYAYKGAYDAISYRYDNRITVREGECYVGQPYTGYALNKDGDKEFIIIGVLMKKEMFYRSFLPVLAADAALLHRELGKTFSQLLLELRMERAVLLLRGTDLPIEDVAVMLGYTNSSNFYKAFRGFYGCSPREFLDKERRA